jgi:hypothetical protein
MEMTGLESTRPGWIVRAQGAGFILLAIGLTVWDLSTRPLGWFALLNVVTLIAGVTTFHVGTLRIRTARKHHEFMEEQRRRWAEVTR